MLELTNVYYQVLNHGAIVAKPANTATLIGDSHQLMNMHKSMDVKIEPSQVVEVPGNFIVFKHFGVPLPEKQEDRTPIKIIHYLFFNEDVGYFIIKAHLTNLDHGEQVGDYVFRGNYDTVNTAEEDHVREMFPHLFKGNQPCLTTPK